MRFRLGLTTGFAAGYYLGSKAGRQRYHQLRSWIDALLGSGAVENVTEKAKAAVDLGVERARDVVEHRREHDPVSLRSGTGPSDLSDLDEGATVPMVAVLPGANGIGG
ncbi:MAG: hypothetical protein WKF43_05690 [Acidimicrobiales bacterium]